MSVDGPTACSNYWVYDLSSIELWVQLFGLPVTQGLDMYHWLVGSANSIGHSNYDQWILCLVLHVYSNFLMHVSYVSFEVETI